jgi:hypothetical protein
MNKHRSLLARLVSFLASAPFALSVVEAAPAAPAPEAAAPAPVPAPAPAAAAPAAARPGVSARLAGALASLAGGLPATVAAEVATTREALTQAQSDLAATRASLESTQTALASVCGFIGLQTTELLGLDDKAVDALCTARLTAAATAQLAQRGFSPAALPPATPGNGDSKTMAASDFVALSSAEKMKFSRAGGRIVE